MSVFPAGETPRGALGRVSSARRILRGAGTCPAGHSGTVRGVTR